MIHIADGTLKFDTKIDNTGAEKGIRTLKGSFNSFLGSIKGLGSKFSNAFNDTSGADKANAKIQSLVGEIDRYTDALYYLEKQGMYFGDKEYDEAYTKLSRLEKELNAYKKSLSSVNTGQNSVTNSSKRMSKSVDKGKKSMDKAKNSAGGLGKSLQLLKMSLMFAVAFQALSGAINAIKTGFQNLVQYSSATNNTISALMTSLLTLKNSLATAFSPILTAITPALQTLINYLSQAITTAGEFFAVFFNGATTFTKAKDAQVDYAASLNASDKAAKKSKNSNKQLSDIDKLHNMTDTGKDNSGSTGTPGMPNPKQMFEDVKINSDIIKAVDEFKKSLAALFEPIKQSWDKYGATVISSAKGVLNSLKTTISEVGKSFATVWTNGTGEKTVSAILKIFIDINNIVKAISDNFRKAWSSDNTGTKIIQNMADILNILLGDIEKAAKATADWAKGLDFSPIFTSFEKLTAALKPITSTLADGLLWLYKNILLPLAGWTITNLLPSFLNLMAGALKVLNSVLVALQPLGQWLWDNFLKPISTWTGGIIVDVLNGLADGLNKLSSWINENQETVQNAAILIGSFFAAFGVVSLATVLAPTIAAIATFATSGAVLSTVLAGIGTAIAAISSPIVIITAALGLLVYSFIDLYKNSESFRKSIADLGQTWATALQPIADFVGTVLTDAWNKLLKPAVDFFVNTLLPQLIKTFENLWQDVLVPLAEFIGVRLQPAFKIFSDVMTMLWKNVVLPLAQAIGGLFKDAWDAVYQILNKTVLPILKIVIDTLTKLWKNVFNPIIDVMWKNVKPAFETVFGGIKTVIEGLKTTLSGIIEFIKGVFTLDWSTAWEGIKKIFKGLWDSLVGVVKVPINLIIDLINGMMGAITDGINVVINALNHLKIDVPGWLTKLTGMKSFGFSIKTLTAPKIPKLATGTVVPANYGEFLATLGDNTREPEVVSPLSTMKQALKEAFTEMGGSGTGNINVNVYLSGKQIHTEVVKVDKEYQNETGKSAFA
ncbi:MAG TPA: hypothetical protein VN131_06780 [Mobilitalea sp.]|nr:hypothetical protein [Mobilitalea sp.]